MERVEVFPYLPILLRHFRVTHPVWCVTWGLEKSPWLGWRREADTHPYL